MNGPSVVSSNMCKISKTVLFVSIIFHRKQEKKRQSTSIKYTCMHKHIKLVSTIAVKLHLNILNVHVNNPRHEMVHLSLQSSNVCKIHNVILFLNITYHRKKEKKRQSTSVITNVSNKSLQSQQNFNNISGMII